MIFSLPTLFCAVEAVTSKAKQVRRLTVEWCGFFPTGTFNQQKGSLKRVVFIPKLGGFKYFFFHFQTPPDSVWEDDPIFDENCAYFSKWVGEKLSTRKGKEGVSPSIIFQGQTR